MRPVLSLPGSCYYSLTKELSLFGKIPQAGIETSTGEITTGVSTITLQEDKVLVSLDVDKLINQRPFRKIYGTGY